MEETNEPIILDLAEEAVELRSASARELDIRLFAWDSPIETRDGVEVIGRGAMDGADPRSIYLMDLQHGAHLALDSVGQPTLRRHTAGRGTAIRDDGVGPVVTIKVGRTQAGDEMLTLYEDGIVTGASAEFVPVRSRVEKRGNRRVRVHEAIRVTGVSMTHIPAAGPPAAVIAMRSKEEHVTEQVDQDANEAVLNAIKDGFASISANADATKQNELNERYLSRIEELETQMRSGFILPSAPEEKKPSLTPGQWVKTVAGLMLGETLPESQLRTIDDVITTDNPGVVPEAFLPRLIGKISRRRPFMETTTRLDMPDAGTTIKVPVINQRPEVAVQSSEKSELASRKTLIGTEDFDMESIGGVGDLSLQLIRRSSPAFLTLWLDLLGSEYAKVCEQRALRALFNAGGGSGNAEALDPDNMSLGSAFQTAFDSALEEPPDTIWLSTEAIVGFINAKATGTNAPLYSTLRTDATVAGGITGTISGLRPVHVPELDTHGSYAIVGPSSGFAWCEEGPLQLQADVPTLAGRDVALVGFVFFIPWYADAFTFYNVAS